MCRCYGLAAVLLICSTPLLPQRRVDPRYSYHRVIACVPLEGSGTPQDPARPKYVPTAQSSGLPGTGIIAFAQEPSDDGKHAIVEYVAVNRQGLAAILTDPDVMVFEKGRVTTAVIESAIRRFRKDFSLSRFGVTVQ